jgi:hypothetical protein
MTDSIQTKEKETSVNAEAAQKKDNIEKPQADGGAQVTEKKEQNSEKKPRLNEELKSTLLFAATSVAAGYASFLLTPAKPAAIPAASLLIVLGIMIAIFFGTQMLIQKLAGKKNMQWIMGNGGAIYLFLWFVSWIIFYNAM